MDTVGGAMVHRKGRGDTERKKRKEWARREENDIFHGLTTTRQTAKDEKKRTMDNSSHNER